MSEELETECLAVLAEQLRRLSQSVTGALRRVITAEHPPTTHLLRFEYDSPDFANTFPVMFCRMDRCGRATEVRKLLPEIPFAIAPEVIDDPRYEQANLDTWALASEAFVPWFADCWEAAGGHQSRWPGYLAHHDSIYSFDLSARRELREPEPSYPDA